MPDINQRIIESLAKDIPLTEICDGLDGVMDKIAFYKTVFSLMEDKRIPNIMVCWCGIDCSRCRTFRATINNDDEMRMIVKSYYEEIGHSIGIGDLSCLGCRSDDMMPGCAGCPYMKCGKEKGVKRCEECAQYPCDSLQWYMDNYIKPGMGKFSII